MATPSGPTEPPNLSRDRGDRPAGGSPGYSVAFS